MLTTHPLVLINSTVLNCLCSVMYIVPYYDICIRHSCTSTKIRYLLLIYLANVAETCNTVIREKKICEEM